MFSDFSGIVDGSFLRFEPCCGHGMELFIFMCECCCMESLSVIRHRQVTIMQVIGKIQFEQVSIPIGQGIKEVDYISHLRASFSG